MFNFRTNVYNIISKIIKCELENSPITRSNRSKLEKKYDLEKTINYFKILNFTLGNSISESVNAFLKEKSMKMLLHLV